MGGSGVAQQSTSDLECQLAQARRELSEAREQQAATAEVLRIISRSPGKLEPVFGAMLENAIRICEAKFGTLWLCEGDAFRAVALHNVPPAYAEFCARRSFRPGLEPDLAGSPLHRLLLSKEIVQRKVSPRQNLRKVSPYFARLR